MGGEAAAAAERFRTGATWRVGSDCVVRMVLGPWETEEDGVAEAEFMQRCFATLKRRLPAGRRVSAVVDLARLARWETAPLQLLKIYAEMTKDPATRRVAIVHATGMQKVLVVPLIKLVARNRDKLDFFDDLGQAEAWAAAD